MVDIVKGVVDVLPDFGAGEDDLAGDEDEEDDLRFNHAVDEAWEQFWLVAAELVVRVREALEALFVTAGERVVSLSVRPGKPESSPPATL